MDVSDLIVGYPQKPLSLLYERVEKMDNLHPRVINWVVPYYQMCTRVRIRPEVALAQALFETGRGHFNGKVPASWHNVAGIKIGVPSQDDVRDDHEKFISWDEGIRGHVNHLCAYVGNKPIGRPHARYFIVKGLEWSGTITTMTELSGKYAPRSDYHEVLKNNFLLPLMQ